MIMSVDQSGHNHKSVEIDGFNLRCRGAGVKQIGFDAVYAAGNDSDGSVHSFPRSASEPSAMKEDCLVSIHIQAFWAA